MTDDEDIPGAGFERAKRSIGFVAGPLVAAIVYVITRDGPSPLLAALMALAVTWWLSEALPAAGVALVRPMSWPFLPSRHRMIWLRSRLNERARSS